MIKDEMYNLLILKKNYFDGISLNYYLRERIKVIRQSENPHKNARIGEVKKELRKSNCQNKLLDRRISEIEKYIKINSNGHTIS